MGGYYHPFDPNVLMQAFMTGRQARQQDEEEAHRRDSLKLEKDLHKHRIRELDIGEKLKELEGRRQALEMMRGVPGKEVRAEGDGGGTTVQPHAPIDFSGLEDLGIPSGTQVQPQTLQDVLAQNIKQKMEESRAAAQGAAEGRRLDVSPEQARAMGLPEGAGKGLDSALLPFLASRPEESITVQPGVAPDIVGPKGGTFKKSELDLMKEQAGNRTKEKVARETNATRLAAASGAGGDPAVVQEYADRLNSGQIKFSEVPRQARGEVLKAMGLSGKGILTQDMQGKLEQFTEANQAVQQIKQGIEDFTNAPMGTQKLSKGLQLRANISALTRLVGRSLGEKGVFTDQDKADFEKLLSPGMVATMLDPQMARDRIGQVEALMQKVKQARLEQFAERSGGQTLPGMPKVGETMQVGKYKVRRVK